MVKSAPTPRQMAVRLLNEVLGEDGRLMSEAVNSGILDPLEPADRARAQRLAVQTLRGLERADKILNQHVKRMPALGILNIMRVATVELCMGGDAHGVVNEAVNLCARNKRYAHFKGLVNAVLRRVAEHGPKEWDILRVPRLPKWLRKPLSDAYSPDIIAKIEAVQFGSPPLDITPKDVSKVGELAALLGGDVILDGSVRLQDAGQVSKLDGFQEGDWWVQDAAAALPVRLLGDIQGLRVLDLCAAPGGKTMQLAAAGADVVALDVSEHRMGRVHENLKRVGLHADICVGDAFEYSDAPFDVILLDAPCSATGTMRRHPDLPHAKDGSEFAELFDIQERMIDHALGLLKPEGRLVYCTCSLLPDEGEVQIDEALERHPSLTVEDLSKVPFVDPDWITHEGGLRLRPDYLAEQGGMDGFYISVLRKSA